MITLNNDNIVLRNIQEQVQKNKEDIAKHFEITEAMSNLGIKVVGQVTTPEQLPDPIEYGGDFGDTFAVGNKTAVEQGLISYQYYVYTRASLTSGEPDNYWLNVGSISIVGPEGPQGPQGPRGYTGDSSKWIVVPGIPPYGYDGAIGDGYMFLSTEGTQKGNVWQFTNDNGFQLMGNIMGPQGIQGIQGPKGDKGDPGEQGPKGETGDAGGFINIAGILDSTSQLPTPASLANLTVAYLIGENRELYIQVGSTSAEAVWNNVGPLNAATLVTSGGVYQNLWDADTKLDKATGATTYHQAYVKSASGPTLMFNMSNDPIEGTIAFRTGAGTLRALEPQTTTDCATKGYVDTLAATKLDKVATTSSYKRAYTTDESGNQGTINLTDTYVAQGTVPMRGPDGAVRVGTPTENNHAATKNYVDTHAGKTYYNHFVTVGVNNYGNLWDFSFISSSATELTRNNFPRYLQGTIAYCGDLSKYAIIGGISNTTLTIINLDGTVESLPISGGAAYSITEI